MKKENQKICFVSIFSYALFNNSCKLNFGGAEVQVSLLSRELASNNNYDISVIVSDVNQIAEEKVDNVRIIKSYKTKAGLLNSLKSPFILYKTLLGINPDVVVCRAMGVEVGISCFYCKKNKKKFFYSIASDKDVCIDKSLNIRKFFFKYGLYNSNFIIAQTEYQLNQIKKNNKLKNKPAILIKNSINITKNNFIDRNLNNNILWVGKPDDNKRPELFIRVAEQMPDFNFIMIMPKENSNKYKFLLKLGSEVKNLTIMEKVGFDYIQKYFSDSSIFINTSIEEGFPNTFLQACLAGTPIISLKVDPDNFIKKYNCGFTCNDNFNNLKSFIIKISSDNNSWKKISYNCQQYLIDNHDIKKNINSWKKILN